MNALKINIFRALSLVLFLTVGVSVAQTHLSDEVKKISLAEALSRGNAAYEKKVYNEAAMYFRLAADKGNVEAERKIGYMFLLGLGVEENRKEAYKEALKWWHKGADKKDSISENNLGYMYDYGLGTEYNFWEAEKYYREAADQGDKVAYWNLLYIYEQGLRWDNFKSDFNARRDAEDKIRQKHDEYIKTKKPEDYRYQNWEKSPWEIENHQWWYCDIYVLSDPPGVHIGLEKITTQEGIFVQEKKYLGDTSKEAPLLLHLNRYADGGPACTYPEHAMFFYFTVEKAGYNLHESPRDHWQSYQYLHVYATEEKAHQYPQTIMISMNPED